MRGGRGYKGQGLVQPQQTISAIVIMQGAFSRVGLKRRSSVIKWALGGIALVALLLVAPAVHDSRERKLEVYRAFASAYSEGHRVNLASVTTRFNVETEGAIHCAPTVLLTTLVSRMFRTTTFDQSDFQNSSIYVVDPETQRTQMRAHDPIRNISAESNESDIERAVMDAFEVGLLQVSEVGFDITGQHAMLTFSFSCGGTCGHGGAALFDRVGDRWVWSQRTCGSEWMS